MIHSCRKDVAYRGPKWRGLKRRGDAMQDHSLALDIKGLSKTFDRPAVNSLDWPCAPASSMPCSARTAPARPRCCVWSPILQPDTGSISVLGIDARRDPIAAKRVIAWVSDEPMVYDRLTPLEIPAIRRRAVADAGRRGRSQCSCAGRLARPRPARQRTLRRFSKGMLQKVALGWRPGARPKAHHPRRTADRP